ncbi:MAG: hypothetical protein ABIY52_08680 [Gemmatimonadaceae bacterium]
MTAILKQAHIECTFGGEDASGWLPPHAPTPPRTPERTVDLLVQIEGSGGGFILQWTGPEREFCGDHWYSELPFAEHAAEELFGITGDDWDTPGSGALPKPIGGHARFPKRTERVMQFRARCDGCSETFPIPMLSDFAYGEFILGGEHGKAFAYLNSFEEPAWTIIRELVPPIPQHDWAPAAALFHRVVAACADPVAGERLSMEPAVCPHCRSNRVVISDADALGPTLLPLASFAAFMRLTADERADMVHALIEQERVR